jgi:hypothetical protein
MNSRRFTARGSRASNRKIAYLGTAGAFCAAGCRSGRVAFGLAAAQRSAQSPGTSLPLISFRKARYTESHAAREGIRLEKSEHPSRPSNIVNRTVTPRRPRNADLREGISDSKGSGPSPGCRPQVPPQHHAHGACAPTASMGFRRTDTATTRALIAVQISEHKHRRPHARSFRLSLPRKVSVFPVCSPAALSALRCARPCTLATVNLHRPFGMAAARHGLPVRFDRAPQRGAAFALASASRRARSIRSRSTGSLVIFECHPAAR